LCWFSQKTVSSKSNRAVIFVTKVSAMSDQTPPQPRRRPGPIGFSGEAQVTSNKISPAPNTGGIGQANTPRKETPRKSKELKVAGPAIWSVAGIFIFVIGIILLSPIVVVGGILVVAVAFAVNRTNQTQKRLRQNVRNSDSESN
jgi:hypothetical protein